MGNFWKEKSFCWPASAIKYRDFRINSLTKGSRSKLLVTESHFYGLGNVLRNCFLKL